MLCDSSKTWACHMRPDEAWQPFKLQVCCSGQEVPGTPIFGLTQVTLSLASRPCTAGHEILLMLRSPSHMHEHGMIHHGTPLMIFLFGVEHDPLCWPKQINKHRLPRKKHHGGQENNEQWSLSRPVGAACCWSESGCTLYCLLVIQCLRTTERSKTVCSFHLESFHIANSFCNSMKWQARV